VAVLSAGLFSAAGAAAGDFNLGVRGAIGFGTGSTDDETVDGTIGLSAGGGLSMQYYFIEKGKWNFGLDSGLEYLFLEYDSTSTLTLPGPTNVDRASNTSYNYLTIPLTFKVHYTLNERLAITGDVGGFLGVFLGGESDNDYTPEVPLFGLVNGVVKLDDTNTETINAGLRFAAGLEIALSDKLKLIPGFIYDLGLVDVTKDAVAPPKDTLSSWTFAFDLLYELF
jgi:hypothetical protein